MKVSSSQNYPALSRPLAALSAEEKLPNSALRRRLRWIQWFAPVAMVLVVIVFEFGPAQWVHRQFSSRYSDLAEVLFYGISGPALTFLLFELLGRWLDARATSELQARALERAYEHARLSHEVTDDALQALFAASVTLSSLENRVPDLPNEVVDQLRQTNRALHPIMQQLYAHQARQPLSAKK